MHETLHRYWWILLLRGIAAILFGLVTLAWPGLSLVVLTLMFGAFALTDGVASLLGAFEWRRRDDRWYAHLAIGLAGLAAGAITLLAPGVTALVLLVFMALWAVGTGMLGIAMAIRLRHEIRGEVWLIGAGVLSVVFGLVALFHPVAGALSLTWLIGSYALAVGVLLVSVALRARAYGHAVAA